MRKYASISAAFLFFALFGVGFVFPGNVHAQPTGLKIQPSIIEDSINPGEVYTDTLRATNISVVEKDFFVIVRDISGITEDGTPTFADKGEATGYELSDWVDVTREPITIGPNKTVEIPIAIEVPENAGPGGHYGAIFLSAQPDDLETIGSSVGFQVGSIINMRISGEVVEDAQIREFRTDRDIYSKPEVTFITNVENLGNVLVRPRGPVDIVNSLGNKVATIKMNDSGAAVFPGGTRIFSGQWEDRGLAFGRYQATMSLVYGEDGRKTITSATAFWILPLNIILPVFGGILLFILLIFVFVRLYVRRKLEKLRLAANRVMPEPMLESIENELLHHRGAPVSRLALTTIVILIFTLIFLIVLFFFFA